MNTEPSKRRALGRGLGALIPGAGLTYEAPQRLGRDSFSAPIEEVYPSPDQPRKIFDEPKLEELAQSIRESGLIQPLVVRKRSELEGGGYYLIAGERRWRAAQRAGLHDVPVVVREAAPARAFELALVENVQREDLNAIEEAEAYRHLADELGYTQEQIAVRVGKDRATVANAMRLLKLPDAVRALVQEGKLTMGHARALLSLDDEETIVRIARMAIAKGLSVRATEDLVRRSKECEPAVPKTSPKTASTRDLEERLTRSLGMRVTVHDRGGNSGGKLEIRYSDLDALDRLIDRLMPANV